MGGLRGLRRGLENEGWRGVWLQEIVAGADPRLALDVELAASGFKPADAAALERFTAAHGGDAAGSDANDSGSDDGAGRSGSGGEAGSGSEEGERSHAGTGQRQHAGLHDVGSGPAAGLAEHGEDIDIGGLDIGKVREQQGAPG